MTSSIVKTVIFTVLVPGTVAVIIPRAIAGDADVPTLLSSIGFLPMALGATIYFRSLRILTYAAIVFVCFSLFVILYEEPALKRKFGGEYEEYKKSVPRWIPR